MNIGHDLPLAMLPPPPPPTLRQLHEHISRLQQELTQAHQAFCVTLDVKLLDRQQALCGQMDLLLRQMQQRLRQQSAQAADGGGF